MTHRNRQWRTWAIGLFAFTLMASGCSAEDRGMNGESRVESSNEPAWLELQAPGEPDRVMIDPISAAEQAKLTAGDGAASYTVGYSAAIDGDTAILGAPDVPSGPGAAYVFVRSGGVWTQQAKLTAGDGVGGDYFGSSVALSGDTAIIGAFYDDVGNVSDAGSAYVFVRSGGVWTQQAKLTASDLASGSTFGIAAAFEGDTAIVGARFHDTGMLGNTGAAYVFVRSGNVWTEQAKLAASDAAASDLFGESVALSGDTALVGAILDDTGPSTNAGSAYVFVRSGNVWTEQAKLTASDAATDDRAGVSVGVSGDTAIVGAFVGDSGAITDAGAAYVFVRSGNMWTEQAKLTAGDATLDDRFGASVAIEGDRAVVGAAADDLGALTNAGSAYVFSRSGSVWTEEVKLAASDGAAGDNFGYAGALSGNTVLIGAYGDDIGNLADVGSAYVYILTPFNNPNGVPCAASTECASQLCVDGVCCNTACSAGACEACSIAAGADVDGVCKLLTGPACDDGNACTQTDTCQSGVCAGTNPILCAASGECHDAGTCDTATGVCSDPAKPDGTACTGGMCQGGVCVPGGAGGGGGQGAGGGGTGGAGGAASSSSTGGTGGAASSSSTGGAASSSSTSGAGGGAASDPGDDGGCGCRTAGSAPAGGAGWALWALALALHARNRGSRARQAHRKEA